MPPSADAINRITDKLDLKVHPIAVYDCPASEAFEPMIASKGRACCFAYYDRWLEGKTLVIRKGSGDFANPTDGCSGAQAAFGFADEYPPFMAHFLTDGVGAPMGEGLKATPELAQEFLDKLRKPQLSQDELLIGPLRPEQWQHVLSVTFFVDPDRLAGVMTLAGYWSSDPGLTVAPFSSGCGMILRSLGEYDEDRVIIGCTDMAMRKYIPPEILSLTVSPQRFEKMTTVPDGSFPDKTWWNELLKARKK